MKRIVFTISDEGTTYDMDGFEGEACFKFATDHDSLVAKDGLRSNSKTVERKKATAKLAQQERVGQR